MGEIKAFNRRVRRGSAKLAKKPGESKYDTTARSTHVHSRPLFRYIICSMLDLNFVRDNLPLVEEKLRQRGLNPAEVLKDFGQVDAQRRQAISAAETLKSHRNRLSEDIAKLKKSGQDATTLLDETKNLREQIQELE